ncbi:MAG: hypothetical protein AB7L84_11510 [Acidimicrobiia bacterium]
MRVFVCYEVEIEPGDGLDAYCDVVRAAGAAALEGWCELVASSVSYEAASAPGALLLAVYPDRVVSYPVAGERAAS